MKSMERLGSGYRINRAADDAASLSISEKMRAQIRGLQRAEDNVQDGISYVQVADGALSNAHDILHRMRELAIQSANDVNTEQDRMYIDEEVQILKDELDRIFEETEFNNKMIWDTTGEGRVQIGTEKKQAVDMRTSYSSFTVTNTNKGAIAYNGYKIEVKGTNPDDAANYGFIVKWEGWNTKQYSTEMISWDDVGVGTNQSYGFNIKDYVDTATHPELEGIGYQIGFNWHESATVDDVANSINGINFSVGISASEYLKSNTSVPGVSYELQINYLSELASDRDMEAYDTDWIQPKLTNGSNVVSAPSYTDPTEDAGWTLEFEMQNIGTVVAKSANVSFKSHDRDEDDEGHWWHWVKNSRGENSYKTANSYSPSVGNAGTLHSITDVITNRGNKLGSNGKKGVSLTDNAESGGVITLRFDLTATEADKAKYEGRQITGVGSLYINIQVYDDDTEATLMNRVKATLNENTILDGYQGYESSGKAQTSTHSIHASSARNNPIDVPIYKATVERIIQAGANGQQIITMSYDSLRTINLGVGDTNVLTREDASKAITEVDVATDMISAQRSLFGAYQNRFEYAMRVNANTAENTQNSESILRDLDMAEEAMNLARITILEQASQSMIANANQQPQNILKLISQ
nr:hypothetical protein [Eubacterium sp.]